jgi:hypothetical protein
MDPSRIFVHIINRVYCVYAAPVVVIDVKGIPQEQDFMTIYAR